MKYCFGLVLFCYVFSDASSRSNFGEQCSRVQKCDRKAYLSCYDGLCGCLKPDEMHYDIQKRKCVAKPGERCKFGVDESGELGLIEIIDCVPNSYCNTDGLCACDNKYHEIFNGTCELSKLFGEACSDEDKCFEFENLHCTDGSCTCREENSVYSIGAKQCVGVMGQSCVLGKCIEGTECRDGKCLCNIDHYEDLSTNPCLPKKDVNEKCNSDSECTHKGLLRLKCLNQTCSCEDGFRMSIVHMRHTFSISPHNDQTYLHLSITNNSVKTCAPLVGRSCQDGYCVPGSKCVIAADRIPNLYLYMYQMNQVNSTRQDEIIPLVSSDVMYNNTVCECLPGLYPNRDFSRCVRSSSSKCQHTVSCNNENHWKCLSGDECISEKRLCDGTPDCIDASDEPNGCPVPIHIQPECPNEFKCITVQKCISKDWRCDGVNDCGDGSDEARCRTLLSPPSSNSEKCFTNECKVNDDCLNNLVCNFGRCKCPSSLHQKESSDHTFCHSKIGSHCKINEDCITNSFCLLEPNATVGHCQCNDNYIDNKDGECDKEYGSPCVYSKFDCDKAANLVCTDEKCSCEDEFMHKYSSTFRKCLGLVGAICNRSVENSCINNAVCAVTNTDLPSRCKCIDGYKENNYTCESIQGRL